MTFGRLQVDVGMDVTDNNANRVGKVKDVHDAEFVVFALERPRHLRMLETAVDHLRDIVFITESIPRDVHGRRVVFVNRTFTHLTGYQPDEVIGQSPDITSGSNSDREILSRFEAGLRERRSVREELLKYRKDGIRVLATRVENLDDKALRELADRLKEKLAPSVIALGTSDGTKVTLVAAVSKDLVKRYHAGNLLKQIAPLVGGGGGGRPDFAQAGGKDPTRLDDALAQVYKIIG